MKLVLTGSGASWSSCISGSLTRGLESDGTLERLRACSLGLGFLRVANPDVDVAGEALLVAGCAVSWPVGRSVVTCNATPLSAGA